MFYPRAGNPDVVFVAFDGNVFVTAGAAVVAASAIVRVPGGSIACSPRSYGN